MRPRPSIFITGAARGIGRACAEHFVANGSFVGLYDVDAEALARTAAALGGAEVCCHASLDVRDHASIVGAIEHFAGHAGDRMDVLLNNAGVMSVGRFEAISPEHHREMIAVNLQGVVEVAHAGFELLRATPGSRLINMSSASALYGTPQMATYSATKHAVRGLTEALEIEWRGHGIRVCDVIPMIVDTRLLTETAPLEAQKVLGVTLTPADVARTVWAAATSERRRIHWPVGLQARLTYRLGKLMPDSLQRLTHAWMSRM